LHCKSEKPSGHAAIDSFQAFMSPPAYAAWFPEINTTLIGKGETGRAELFFEIAPEPAPGSANPARHRRYWELADEGVTRLTVDARAQHGFYLRGEHSAVQLGLASELDAGEELLVVLHTADPAGRELRLQFMALRWQVTDGAELHARVREGLPLGPHQLVRRVWRARYSFANGRMRLAPAVPVWPHGSSRRVEVQPLRETPGPRSRIELLVRHDRYQDNAQAVPADLSATDDGTVILLVWRSLFSGRMARQSEPSAFVREFQDSIAKHLGRQIKFGTSPRELAAGGRRPIASGRFLPSAAGTAQAEVKPGDPVRYAFEGPCDMYDVVTLCVPSLAERPRELTLHRDFEGAPDTFNRENNDASVLCWRADLDRLTPIAWDDAKRETHGTMEAELGDALRKLRAQVEQADAESAAALGADAFGSAPVSQAIALQASELFQVDDHLRGALEAWFATLSPDPVGGLWASRGQDRLIVTNLARFLPLDAAGIRADKASWDILERNAADLYRLLGAIRQLIDSSPGVPASDVRSDRDLWAAIDGALDRVPIEDKSATRVAAAALAPSASGSLHPLDPAMIKVAVARFNELYKALASVASAELTAKAE
jgi:hypothetical protein